MEENKDKKAIQELKDFIEKINKPKENEIFEKEQIFTETLEKIENLEKEETAKN